MKTSSKVVLLGKSNAGKTCLIYRYINKTYAELCDTTIAGEYESMVEEVRGKSICLEIWDTAGQEQFESLGSLYYRNAVAAILCYDITDRPSFDRACYWSKELQHNQKDCEVFLCGTKKDLVDEKVKPRMITSEKIKLLAGDHQAAVFEVSSKTGENVDRLFKAVAEYCMQKKENALRNKEEITNRVRLTTENCQPKKSCKSYFRCSK